MCTRTNLPWYHLIWHNNMPALILNADKRITLLGKFFTRLLHYRLGSVLRIRVHLKIALKQNAEEFFKSKEKARKHSREAMLRDFDAAIGKFIKLCKK